QEYGYVKNRPYLGITTKDLDSATAKNYGLPVGVRIVSVVEGSCAETAGLQEGDIITALNEREVGCYTDLVAALNRHRAGENVMLTVFRSGAELNLPVTLDERPKDLETKVAEENAAPDTQAPSESSPTNPGYGQDSMPFDFNWPFGFGFGFGG
ncbi:MAG: PDZ domain-containing protein, partial [Clostridia bacterium]|nr:PDZ domain-containing protein [Clostridia bacterium]